MQIVVLAHNIRSTFNVGSILRTSDGFGVEKVIFSGYTPYPVIPDDTRLPHIREKIADQIHKTALGAERSVPNEYVEDIFAKIDELHRDGFIVFALEQAPNSVRLQEFNCYLTEEDYKVALILGEEVAGIEAELLKKADVVLEIPMIGQKESFNVSSAFAAAIWEMVR
jgi:tRNA G18 (ribose-2'-O)-methylase SpoU